jgi:hypothetical protein
MERLSYVPGTVLWRVCLILEGASPSDDEADVDVIIRKFIHSIFIKLQLI